jgi:hypothetical protein
MHLLTKLKCLYLQPSGFPGIYDVEHFIKTLKYDVCIVKSLPEVTSKGKTKKLKAYQVLISDAMFTVFFSIFLIFIGLNYTKKDICALSDTS